MRYKVLDTFLKIILVTVAVWTIFIFTSCNTFEPVTVDGETSECNAMYTSWDFSVRLQGFTKKGETSGEGIVSLLTKECIDSWKRRRIRDLENNCRSKVYGEGMVSQEGKDQYILYLKCLSSKN